MEGGQSLTPKLKIYLDAGHGGKDSGAVGNALYEKNVVLDIAKRVEKKLNEYQNVEIMQSRKTDVFLELSERTSKANKWGADAFISLHLNSALNPYAKGFETYVYNSTGEDTQAFQNIMHKEIFAQLRDKATDRGKKKANFHVLRESHMKAILVENLFISNKKDSALLKQTAVLDRIAQGYVNGLRSFFGLVKEIRPPVENIDEKSPMYQVIAGTFSDFDNAEAQVKKLSADGYSAYIQEK